MTKSNRLPTLADEARQAHSEILHHVESAAKRALAAGAALAEAKALCAHGKWGDWLAETGIPERSAQRYMRLHRAGLKSATVADLGLSQAERIAGVIEKAWPQANRGRVLTGSRGDESFWAVTFRPDEAEFSFYGMVHFYGVAANSFGLGGHAVAMGKPIAPVGLAMGHLSEVGAIPILGQIDFAADCADAWFDTVGARLVRHVWGTRLEGAI